ncbi:hypothetical protein L1987_03445 [Smallanthus sonchifolius]|uniref:Uncharacterized protein n=1 Tax=Smallanthus sonchifolius TaxID=185202 RepID=A0ACB9KAW8_9ASTR|nr:hypothetical protein L1987_03445 [Smallanthus sonchifolius]
MLDLETSGKGGIGKYVGVCFFIAVSGVADAHVQGGMVGDLALMCPEFIRVNTLLITKGAFENVKHGLRKGALVYLAISTLCELLCILLYAFFFPNLPVVKYYRAKAAREGSKTVASDLIAAGVQLEFEHGPEKNALGNLLVLALQIGIFFGVALDWLWIIGNGNF